MLKTSEIEPMCEIWKIVVVFHEKKSYCRTAASECWSSAKLGKNSSNPGSYLLLSGINISWGLKLFRYSCKQPRIPKFASLFHQQREILKISVLEVQRFLSEYEVNKFLEMKVTSNKFLKHVINEVNFSDLLMIFSQYWSLISKTLHTDFVISSFNWLAHVSFSRPQKKRHSCCLLLVGG